jgi:ribosomal protein S18 acetylase RimI-like enzyme
MAADSGPEISHPPIAVLETLGLRGWPAAEVEPLDGWLMRASSGYTKRANSVNALKPPTTDLGQRIDQAEAFYAARNLPTIFRLTPLCEDNLDAALSNRGYLKSGESLVLHTTLAPNLPAPDDVEIEPVAVQAWIDGYAAAADVSPAHQKILTELLGQIAPRSGFAHLGEIAFGRATVEAGYVGFYSIAIQKDFRRQGHGRHLCEALSSWGQRRGAHRGYLGVEADNKPALQLYRSLGFHEAYSYHYRIKS